MVPGRPEGPDLTLAGGVASEPTAGAQRRRRLSGRSVASLRKGRATDDVYVPPERISVRGAMFSRRYWSANTSPIANARGSVDEVGERFQRRGVGFGVRLGAKGAASSPST